MGLACQRHIPRFVIFAHDSFGQANRCLYPVCHFGWYGMGLPRENIIEPQLGYALRHVVTKLQQGQGCGHGLVGILEIDKS